MDIRKSIVILVLLYSTVLMANVERDSISIDSRWNKWHVDAIAPDGDWALVFQSFLNDYSKNKGFAVNTDTKERVEVTGISQPQFTSNSFLIGTRSQETIEVDLITNLRTSLGTLSQKDWIEERQTLCYINNEKELVLKKYAKKRNEVVFTKKGVVKYVINPSKTSLLYQRDDSV